MKIGDIVIPAQETVDRSFNSFPAHRKYQVVRELTQDCFMLKDLVTGSYYSGYTDEFVLIELS